jgi:3-oxoadipate enol-lactonase
MREVVNGNEVNYIDVGEKGRLPIVLIHGFPFSHEMWEPQIQALQKQFRVIAYDLRGHGKSSVGDGQYMLEFFVDDLIGLLDHLKIGKAAICGLSMGGYIALRAAERNPDRVLALVLADTQAKADSNESKLKRAAGIKSVKTEDTNAYAETYVKGVFTAESIAKKLEAVEKMKRIIQSNSPLGICGALLALATRTDTTQALSNFEMPTLILVGEKDSSTPPSAAKEMQASLPSSEIHIIPNAAHLSNLENPDEFNKHLLSFLGRLDPDTK